MLTKAKVNIQQDLDGIFNFLSHLAFKLYSLESKKISSSEFSEFLKEYETKVSIRPTPIAFSKHEAGAHQYPYLYG